MTAVAATPLADARRNCATSATAGDVPERHMFASFYVIPCFQDTIEQLHM